MDYYKMPPIQIYSLLLKKASIKFKITMDEARNKYGLYTCQEWEKLLNLSIKDLI